MRTPNIIIKELRERYGLSIRKLGSLIDISFSSLSKIERGEGSPNMKTINALTHFFNVTSDYILGTGLEGFILSYEEDGKNYCNIITESALDKLIENKEIEESVGIKCINRTILSQRVIDEIKRGMYYNKGELKENPYLEFDCGIPPYEHNYEVKVMNPEIMKAYTSLSDVQRKLVDDLILSLAGGNKNGQ